MNTVSGAAKRNVTLIILAIIAIFLLAGVFFTSSFFKDNSSHESVPEDHIAIISQGLLEYAEDMNDVLPQRIGTNTTFDSVSVAPEKLYYFYTEENLRFQEIQEGSVRDSLITEAEGRIPCTLWRPLYMQGVEVTFSYYSAEDGNKLLEFSRIQDQCHGI